MMLQTFSILTLCSKITSRIYSWDWSFSSQSHHHIDIPIIWLCISFWIEGASGLGPAGSFGTGEIQNTSRQEVVAQLHIAVLRQSRIHLLWVKSSQINREKWRLFILLPYFLWFYAFWMGCFLPLQKEGGVLVESRTREGNMENKDTTKESVKEWVLLHLYFPNLLIISSWISLLWWPALQNMKCTHLKHVCTVQHSLTGQESPLRFDISMILICSGVWCSDGQHTDFGWPLNPHQKYMATGQSNMQWPILKIEEDEVICWVPSVTCWVLHFTCYKEFLLYFTWPLIVTCLYSQLRRSFGNMPIREAENDSSIIN